MSLQKRTAISSGSFTLACKNATPTLAVSASCSRTQKLYSCCTDSATAISQLQSELYGCAGELPAAAIIATQQQRYAGPAFVV